MRSIRTAGRKTEIDCPQSFIAIASVNPQFSPTHKSYLTQSIMKPRLILLAVLPIIASPAQAAIHLWNFDETAGIGIEATTNSGTSASLGAPTWGEPANNNAGDWATTGSAMRITGNNNEASTLATSVVSMSDLNTGTIRFEWDLSWTLTAAPGVVRETFLINRDGGGSNRFRWTLTNPSSSTPTDPLMRLNLDGNGFAALNNLTFTQDELVMNGFGANLVLQADFTFGDVGGNNGVTALAARYSYNSDSFSEINIGTFTPYAVANLNDLRLHSKGALSDTQYLDFNSVSVTVIPEPGAALLGGLGLLALLRRRRN